MGFISFRQSRFHRGEEMVVENDESTLFVSRGEWTGDIIIECGLGSARVNADEANRIADHLKHLASIQ